jgi:hypothetical protein
VLSVCLVLAALPAAAARQPCGDDDDEVRVSVVAVLANDRDDKVDKRLECIAREVQKLDPTLTGFAVGKMTCTPVEVGQTGKFRLVDDEAVSITVESRCGKDGRVRLKVAPPTLGEITYTTSCGKFLPIVTRYRTKKDELLIVAIRVQPCAGEK